MVYSSRKEYQTFYCVDGTLILRYEKFNGGPDSMPWLLTLEKAVARLKILMPLKYVVPMRLGDDAIHGWGDQPADVNQDYHQLRNELILIFSWLTDEEAERFRLEQEQLAGAETGAKLGDEPAASPVNPTVNCPQDSDRRAEPIRLPQLSDGNTGGGSGYGTASNIVATTAEEHQNNASAQRQQPEYKEVQHATASSGEAVAGSGEAIVACEKAQAAQASDVSAAKRSSERVVAAESISAAKSARESDVLAAELSDESFFVVESIRTSISAPSEEEPREIAVSGEAAVACDQAQAAHDVLAAKRSSASVVAVESISAVSESSAESVKVVKSTGTSISEQSAEERLEIAVNSKAIIAYNEVQVASERSSESFDAAEPNSVSVAAAKSTCESVSVLSAEQHNREIDSAEWNSKNGEAIMSRSGFLSAGSAGDERMRPAI